MFFCRRIAVIALPVFFLALLAGCDAEDVGPTQTREGAFSYQAPLAAGRTLHIRTARGNIVVEPAADDTLRVRGDVTWRGTGDAMQGIQLTGTEVGDGVLVCAIWGRTACNVDNYNADLGDARRTRVSFHVRVPSGVKLELVAIDGNVTTASTAPVLVRTVNGDIAVVTSRGPVRAETVNGDVDARMTTLEGTDSVIVKTLNGEAWAFVPEGAALSVDLGITNGSLVTDFPALAGMGSARSLQAVLGAGTTPVRVRSFNGTAGLRRLNAEGRAYEVVTP